MDNDSHKITAEAAEWLVQLRDLEDPASGYTAEESQRQRQAFEKWLLQSPEHVGEYLEISQLWGDLGNKGVGQPLQALAEKSGLAGTEPAGNIEIDTVTGSATAAGERSHVAAESGVVQLRSAQSGQRKPHRWHYYGMAASLLLALSVILLWPASEQNFATGVGEQATIALEDGSTVKLNTQSAIQVSYGGAERRVQLLYGEALFTVVTDALHPFIVDTNVETGRAHVRVLGTRFNVYQHNDHTSVTVIEGSVMASPGKYDDVLPRESAKMASPDGPAYGAATLLEGGQQLVMRLADDDDETGASKKTFSMSVSDNVNVKQALAWTEKKLVFDDQTLVEIVSEFNRYNKRKLQIDGAALGQMRLSGVFNTSEPDALLDYLVQLQGIKVEKAPGGDVLIIDHR